jgi:hypothetical protein
MFFISVIPFSRESAVRPLDERLDSYRRQELPANALTAPELPMKGFLDQGQVQTEITEILSVDGV